MSDIIRPLEVIEAETESEFNQLVRYCKPRYKTDIGMLNDIFNIFFSGRRPTNFIGGCNDTRRTLHENMFAVLFPGLKQQVSFGTGKGGVEKYLCKRYIVDFYNESDKTACEINGKSHNMDLRKIKDRIKKCCLYIEHGVTMYEFTNKEVENLAKERIRKNLLRMRGIEDAG